MDPITLALLSVAGAVLKDAVGDFAGEVLRDLAKDLCKEQTRSLAGRLAGACKAVLTRTDSGRAALKNAEKVAAESSKSAEILLTESMQEQAEALRADPDLVAGLRTLLAELRALPKDILAPPVTLPALTPGQSAAIKAGERHLDTLLDHPEPATQSDETRHQTRLTFTTRLTPFRGRDAEFGQLQTFAAEDAPFRWWLITGNGGAGKSRLAQELCLSLAEQGWHTGFLRGSPTALAEALIDNGGVISGNAPMLLVVDYCDPYAEALRRLIACLQRRPPEATPKVRLLLVERDADQAWYTQTLTGPGDDRAAVEASRHAAPLALPDFDDGQAWAMAEGYITAVAGLAKTHAAPVERATFLTHARSADPTLRPLTVLLLADGPAHGTALGSGTPAQLSTLLDDHLQRLEARFWRGVDEKHRTLLCAATLFRGLPVALLSHPWLGLEDALPYGRAYNATHYRRLTGSPDSRTQLAPLQPDLLGEYYVLDTLHRQSTGAFDLRDRLLTARWEEIAQFGSILFSHLCTRDFAAVTAIAQSGMIPGQAAADLLLAIRPENRGLRRLKALVLVDATVFCGLAKNLDICLRLLTALDVLHSTHPNDAELRRLWAKGAFNLLHCHTEAGNIPAASALLDKLNMVRSAHSTDANLRLEWSNGAINLIKALGTAGNVPAASTLLNELDNACSAHPDDTNLALAWAHGAVNLIHFHGESGNIPAASLLLDKLNTARAHDPDNAELRLRWAQGSLNLSLYFLRIGDINAVASVINALDTVRSVYPDDTDLRLEWAEVAINLINALTTAGNTPAATSLLNTLDDVCTAFPADAGLRREWAKGVACMIPAHLTAGNIAAATVLLTALDSARADFPSDADLRLEWTQAATPLIKTLAAAGDITAATALLAELGAACAAHPDDADLRLKWASAAVNIIPSLCTAGALTDATMLLKALDNACLAHPNDRDLKLNWTNAAVNIIPSLCTAGALSDVALLLNALDTTHSLDPDDAELRLGWAQGYFNVIITFGEIGRIPTATALLTALDKARAVFPGDTSLLQLWAQGALNLAIAYAKKGNFPEFFTRLDAVLSTSGLPKKFLAQVQGIRQQVLAVLPQDA